MPRATDHLYAVNRGPREREAFEMISARPGITVAELAQQLGVSEARAHQIVKRLEAGRVRRDRV